MKEGWKKVKIEDIGEVISGGTPKTSNSEYWNGDIVWLTPKDFSNNSNKYWKKGERNITEEGLKNSSAKLMPKGTILFSSRAPIGYLGIAEIELCTNQGFKNLIVNQNYNNEFIYYLLKYETSNIENIANGSTFKEVSATTFKNYEVFIPENKNIQKKIASILSSLDEKIELNSKINQNLEEITQTLFKRWFIDFEFPNEEGKPYKSSGGKMIESELGEIPEGWRVGKLGEILGLRKENISKEELLENLIYLPIDCLPKKSLAVTEIKSSKEAESSLQLFYENDIVFGAVRAYFHKIIVSPFIGITRKTCFVLKIKEIEKFCFGIMTIYQDKTVKYANAHSKGSTMPYAVWENGLEDMPILIPENNLLTLFNKKLISNFEMIKKNSLQNFKLISIRDYLLPKLMNGEINVSNLKISEISNSD